MGRGAGGSRGQRELDCISPDAESRVPMTTQGQPRSGPAPEGLMLQYLVVLSRTDPLVWRRILVPAMYSFWDLHVAIQDSMGWQDYHLHLFEIIGRQSGTAMKLGIPDDEIPEDRSVKADWFEFPLDYVYGDTPLIKYTYDFGDDWEHAVVFEGYEYSEPRWREPKCVGGANACPPEDCGGPGGYARLLAVLADPKDPEHEELAEWAGGQVDPTEFSADAIRFSDPKERWKIAFEGDAI